jgi:hypothetical protein
MCFEHRKALEMNPIFMYTPRVRRVGSAENLRSGPLYRLSSITPNDFITEDFKNMCLRLAKWVSLRVSISMCLIGGLYATPDLTVVSSINPTAGGNSYQYSISPVGGDLFSFVLAVDTGLVNGNSITSPTGWSFIADTSSIAWTSDSPIFDVLGGTMLAGFGLEAMGLPSTLNYVGVFSDSIAGSVFVPGTTLGPLAADVPEATGGVAVFLGLTFIGVLKQLGRTRSSKEFR